MVSPHEGSERGHHARSPVGTQEKARPRGAFSRAQGGQQTVSPQEGTRGVALTPRGLGESGFMRSAIARRS
jgi:hypothetical protein